METIPTKTELLTNEYDSIFEVIKTVDGDIAKLEEQIVTVKQQRLSLEYVLQALANEIGRDCGDAPNPEPEQLEFDLCVD